MALWNRPSAGVPVSAERPKLSDGGHKAHRLQLRREAAVRCSALILPSKPSVVRVIMEAMGGECIEHPPRNQSY